MCGLPDSIGYSTALAVIGVANVIGSLLVGKIYEKQSHAKSVGQLVFNSSVCGYVLCVCSQDRTHLVSFCGTLGVTWLATVPPTAGLVGGMFGLRNSTLFGPDHALTSSGRILGAYLGGLAVEFT